MYIYITIFIVFAQSYSTCCEDKGDQWKKQKTEFWLCLFLTYKQKNCDIYLPLTVDT